MARNIFLMFGPPGSGKGTQSEMLAQTINLPTISTGNILREERRLGSDIGKQVGAVMDQGDLVPNKIVVKLVEDHLAELGTEKGVILDGFPRNAEQLTSFSKILDITDVLYLIQIEIADNVVIQHISGRRVCSVCGASYHLKYNPPKKDGFCDKCGGKLEIRNDDQPEVVQKRLNNYHRDMQKILENKQIKQIIKINGEQSIQKVHEEIVAEIKKIPKYENIN